MKGQGFHWSKCIREDREVCQMFWSVKRLKRANRCILWLLKSQENILVWVPHRAWPQPETSTGSTFWGERCPQLRLDTCIFNMPFSGMLQTVSLSVLVICPNQVRVIANRTTNIFCFLLWLMKDSKYSVSPFKLE